jgi:uncharacterized protein (DUF1499 family)
MKLKILIMVVLSLALFSCKGAEPTDIGVRDGQLHDCPGSPNCVSSFTSDNTKYAEPISVNPHLSVAQAMQVTKDTLLAMPRVTLREEQGNYFWLEYRTRLGFVDDVELLYDPQQHQFYFRSASRVGYSDLGMNRRRYNQIKSALQGAYHAQIENSDSAKSDTSNTSLR